MWANPSGVADARPTVVLCAPSVSLTGADPFSAFAPTIRGIFGNRAVDALEPRVANALHLKEVAHIAHPTPGAGDTILL